MTPPETQPKIQSLIWYLVIIYWQAAVVYTY